MLAASMGGSAWPGSTTVLSQLAIAAAVPAMHASFTIGSARKRSMRLAESSLNVISEVEGVREAGHERRGLADVATAKRMGRAEIESQVREARQEVHDLCVR